MGKAEQPGVREASRTTGGLKDEDTIRGWCAAPARELLRSATEG
jgi:hypothetical protein